MRAMVIWLLVGVLGLAITTQAQAKPSELVPHTRDVPWLHESDFDGDPRLYAIPGQTVILELEGRDRPPWGGLAVSEIRILFNRPRDFELCLAEEVPYVETVSLRGSQGNTIHRYRRGSPCKPLTIDAGTYRIQVSHDVRSVPPRGQAAFFRVTRAASAGGGLMYTVDPSGCPGCDLTGADLSAQSFPGANFTGAILSDAILDGADFESARFDDATLKGASLTGADFTGAFVSCANFSGAVLGELFGAGRIGVIYVDGNVQGRLVRVDATSGVRAVVSGSSIGATYSNLVDVAVLQDGSLLTLDLFYDGKGDTTLYHVEPARGVATVVSNSTVGSGPVFGGPYSVGAARDGSYLVLAESSPGSGIVALWQVDPATGARQIVSDSNTGTGPSLGSFSGFAVDSDGTVLAPGSASGTILRVDLATGDRSVVTGSGTGSGTALSEIRDILVTSAGSLVVVDGARLVSVDPGSGARSVISAATTGSGTRMRTPIGVVEADHGSLLVSDFGLPGILQVNPATGDRTEISSPDIGGGTNLGGPSLLVEYPVTTSIAPEPTCRLDVSESVLDVTTFPIEDWRYMNLSNATINGVKGATLSTRDAPVDLSGALLSGVDMSGVVLDFANLGCFEGTGTTGVPCPASTPTRNCTTLQGTVLSGASLKQACLSGASMEGAFLSFSNLDGADMSGVQLQAQVGGKVSTLEGAFMRNVALSGANLTGVRAQNVNFYPAQGGSADATGLTAPGADFSGAYLSFADFSGAGSFADLQSTTWTGALLLGANFSQADLSTNTSGGVNSGTNTTFEGAYMQGTRFENGTILDDVDFSNTYWDPSAAGGGLNLLIPKQNLQFTGYWKEIDLPECPQTLKWVSGNPPPMGVTNSDNTCPDTLPGPCDAVWDQPKVDNSLAFFQSALPPLYPQDPSAPFGNQCSGSFSDPNPFDLCWTTSTEPPPAQCVGNP